MPRYLKVINKYRKLKKGEVCFKDIIFKIINSFISYFCGFYEMPVKIEIY